MLNVKISAGEKKSVETTCGSIPISGGFQAPIGLDVIFSRPSAAGWSFKLINRTKQELSFAPQAVCVGPALQRDQLGR